MNRRLNYLVLSLAILLACCNNNPDRFSYSGYSVVDRIDDNWEVLSAEIESEFKYLQNVSDSQLVCRTIADTIWSLMKFGLSDVEMAEIKSHIDASLKIVSDSTFIRNVAGIWNCIEYKWYDLVYRDSVRFDRCTGIIQDDFGPWFLEVRNDSLLDYLSSIHDPNYHIPVPSPPKNWK